jgi:cation diffusion facilitator CzcD-associated flavoprotein CzcO
MTDQPPATADQYAAEELRLLGYGTANLIIPIEGVDHDVAVVGAGQTGVAIAYALRRAGVANVTVLDAEADETRVPWRTTARMRILRTPKTAPGPEHGVAALTFQAWYDRTRGTGSFDAIDRIATADWADYLDWFRRQVGVVPRRGIRVTDLQPADTGIALHLDQNGRTWTERARKVVLATGVSGTGGPYVPTVLRGLDQRFWAHTADDIDFVALNGKSVAVLGAAASAFDAAATALEAGAADVHVYTRRPALVVARAGGSRQNPLVQDVYHLLPDERRWQQRFRTAQAGASVPQESVDRAQAFPNYHLHVSAPWQSVSEQDGRVIVDAADGTATFDFLIAGTGYQQDPATRSELASLAPYVARWSDVYTPPAGQEIEQAGSAPYLGPGYQLTERKPGTAPWLADIHVFSIGASISFGRPVGDIPSLRSGVALLVEAVTRDLVLADLARAAQASATDHPAGKRP